MRAFLAVNLNTELREELAQIQNKLRSEIRGMRWVAPQLLHITLKFLGELDDDLLPVLERPLQRLGENTAAFIVSLAHLGAFPSLNNPRVFWIGVEEGACQLSKLAVNIEQCLKFLKPLQARGHAWKNTGKPFQPHITIARNKKKGEPLVAGRDVFEKIGVCKNMLHVKSFYLMRSTLYPTGPVYTPVREFLFKPQK